MDIIQSLFGLYWSNSLFIFLFICCIGVYFELRINNFFSINRKHFFVTFFERLFPYGILSLAATHMLLYLAVPNFTDYGEPVMLLLAGNLAVGAPVYADWMEGSSIVGSNYGPNVFLMQLPVVLLFKSIFASKMMGILAALAALIVFYNVIRREVGADYALWFCAGIVIILVYNLHYWFWNRPDSFLFLISSLACLAYQRLSILWFWPSVATLAAIAINFKLFAPIYLVPFAVLTLLKEPLNKKYLLSLAVSSIMSLAIFAAPFALFNFDYKVYFQNIILMSNQGVDSTLALSSLAYGAVICFLPIYLAIRYKTSRETKIFSALLILCAFILAIISGKPGGGSPYLMPFAPLAFYISAKAIRDLDEEERRIRPELALYIVTGFICTAPIWAYSWYQMARQLPVWEQELTKAADLTRLFSQYPDAQMGHGLPRAGKLFSSDEYYRIYKSLLGQPVRFDYVNYVDQRLAGVQPSVLYPLFKNCSVPAWIFSKSTDKFGATGYYGIQTFDNHVRELFNHNYKLDKDTLYFQVWTCKI